MKKILLLFSALFITQIGFSQGLKMSCTLNRNDFTKIQYESGIYRLLAPSSLTIEGGLSLTYPLNRETTVELGLLYGRHRMQLLANVQDSSNPDFNFDIEPRLDNDYYQVVLHLTQTLFQTKKWRTYFGMGTTFRLVEGTTNVEMGVSEANNPAPIYYSILSGKQSYFLGDLSLGIERRLPYHNTLGLRIGYSQAFGNVVEGGYAIYPEDVQKRSTGYISTKSQQIKVELSYTHNFGGDRYESLEQAGKPFKAKDKKGSLWIGAGSGLTVGLSSASFGKGNIFTDFEPIPWKPYHGSLMYYWNNRWAVQAEVSNYFLWQGNSISAKFVGDELTPFVAVGTYSGGSQMYATTLSARYDFYSHRRWQCYTNFGIGYHRAEVALAKGALSGFATETIGKNPILYERRASDYSLRQDFLALQAGIGVDFYLSPELSIFGSLNFVKGISGAFTKRAAFEKNYRYNREEFKTIYWYGDQVNFKAGARYNLATFWGN